MDLFRHLADCLSKFSHLKKSWKEPTKKNYRLMPGEPTKEISSTK